MDPDPDSAPDPDPALFVNGFQDANKKYVFSRLFCIFLFEGTFTSVFKDKKWWIQIRIREAQKLTDPADLDPHHRI
jgi:hypothetical protein